MSDLADEILGSESFMWLMVGANHPYVHIEAIRPAWNEWRKTHASWGKPVPNQEDPLNYEDYDYLPEDEFDNDELEWLNENTTSN